MSQSKALSSTRKAKVSTRAVQKVQVWRQEGFKEQSEEMQEGERFVSITIYPHAIKHLQVAHAVVAGTSASKQTASRITRSMWRTRTNCPNRALTDLLHRWRVSQQQTLSFWSCLQAQGV